MQAGDAKRVWGSRCDGSPLQTGTVIAISIDLVCYQGRSFFLFEGFSRGVGVRDFSVSVSSHGREVDCFQGGCNGKSL